jgi:hypothetical protein
MLLAPSEISLKNGLCIKKSGMAGRGKEGQAMTKYV